MEKQANGVAPYNQSDNKLPVEVSSNNLANFSNLINTAPPKKEVKINSQANNSQYLPISFVENKLDEVFSGLWQIKNFRWQVIANEIVGSIELGVYHPILKEWIWREGAGATIIQQLSKQKGGTGDITNIGDKIKNTLVKDFPHLKAECLKNAAKSLGKMFGRDLNREFEDSYTPIQDTIEAEGFMAQIERAKSTEQIVQIVNENGLENNSEVAEYILKTAATENELRALYSNFPAWKKHPVIARKASERLAQIKKG